MKLRAALSTISPYTPGVLKEGALKLASNENPLGASPKAVARLREAAGEVSLYPDAGCVRLKQALAERFKLTPDRFVVGNGSDEILTFCAGAYVEPGTNAVTSEHTFSEYTFNTLLYGGSMKYAPMKDGRFQLDKLAGLVDAKTRVVFLCNPNNPTGTCFGARAFEDFLKAVSDQILVVADEAYYEYVSGPDFPKTVELLERHPNLIVLRTFSKIYGLAGLRIGYGISNPELIRHLHMTKEPFNVNLLAQAAALAALDDRDFLEKSIGVNAAGKAFLYREFERLGLRYYPSEANFICFDARRDCIKLFQRLMELGVTIRPLKSFGLDSWMRVTVGSPEQNRLFIGCLERALSE